MRLIRRIISWIYTLVVIIRHRLYDWGVLKSYSFDIPVVCIGNITVGGTGKTPTAEYILASLAGHYTMAILSRGYGRTTKGYREVTTDDVYSDVGDEPLQMKLKFPNTIVVVSEDRVAGINRIRQEHPEVNLIIMDDGFQHRRVRPKVNILIVDSTRPYENDHMLPLGRLRDLPSRLKEGHIFIVSKCSDTMSPIDKRIWYNKLRDKAYHEVFFSNIEAIDIEPLYAFDDQEKPYFSQQVILVSGIGNPRPFIREAETRYNVVGKHIFPDHHNFTIEDLKSIYATLNEHPRAFILTTEKDAVRLRRARMPEKMMRAMYYQPIAMRLVEGPERHSFVDSLIKSIREKRDEEKVGKNRDKKQSKGTPIDDEI